MTTPPPSPPPPGRRAAPAVALVLAGGEGIPTDGHRRLRAEVGDGDPFVVAADSGLHHAQDGGWPVDLVVGDLDSVEPARLAEAERAGARIDRHPEAKDFTDLELALDAAVGTGAARVVVAGLGGGRLDHLLANLLLLGSDRFAAAQVDALVGDAWVHVVRGSVAWVGGRGDLVTLLALHGAVTGVTTAGLLYPLRDATLQPGSTRGVSNEQVEPDARVEVGGGVLAVVRPGEPGTHVLDAPTRSRP